MKVMVSGHFNPFHSGHLSYFRQARDYGDFIICVVTSNNQVMMKKGQIIITDKQRADLVDIILRGLGFKHEVVINCYDCDTLLVAKAIRALEPDVFCRGGDKILDDIPYAEWRACTDLGIKIVHAKLEVDIHSSRIMG